jgi:hypothetical protein
MMSALTPKADISAFGLNFPNLAPYFSGLIIFETLSQPFPKKLSQAVAGV